MYDRLLPLKETKIETNRFVGIDIKPTPKKPQCIS